MAFERVTPESVGISSYKILEFMERCKEKGLQLHSFMFVRDGKVFAETWYRPYNKDSKHAMYSFTKSLTSTAIGFCVQEGKLDLSEKIADILFDCVPTETSINFEKVTVRDLLIMGSGHHTEPGVYGEDWIKKWFSVRIEHKPGTYFAYNTTGTNILCAILKRKTGKDMTEYLYEKLFSKIGMGKVPCVKMPDGIEAGGAGSKMTTEQMALFIQFVMNKGNWNGEQLLNSEWFEAALSKQIDTKHSNSIPDWCLGYGYQFWMCQPEGVVRADGAYGQFGIMYPEKNAFFVIQGSSINNFEVLQAVWDTFIGEFKDEKLPEDKEANAVLNYVLKNNEIIPLQSKRVYSSMNEYAKLRYAPAEELKGGAEALIGGYADEAEGNEIKELSLDFVGNECILAVKTCCGVEKIRISLESHYNTFDLNGVTYGAVGSWEKTDEFLFHIYCAEEPNGYKVTLRFDGKKLILRSNSTYPENRWAQKERVNFLFNLI